MTGKDKAEIIINRNSCIGGQMIIGKPEFEV